MSAGRRRDHSLAACLKTLLAPLTAGCHRTGEYSLGMDYYDRVRCRRHFTDQLLKLRLGELSANVDEQDHATCMSTVAKQRQSPIGFLSPDVRQERL